MFKKPFNGIAALSDAAIIMFWTFPDDLYR